MSQQNVLTTERYGLYFRLLDRIIIDRCVPDCPICGHNLKTDTTDRIGLSENFPHIDMTVTCTNRDSCGLDIQAEILLGKDGPAYRELSARRLGRTGTVLPPGQWPEPLRQTETPAEGRANRQINM